MATDTHFSLLPKIFNGGIAGIVGVTCVFPIDLVKTRLQNQRPGPGGQLLYKNLLDCAKKTFSNEGFFGMYKGSGVNLLLITPEKAIKLVGNDFFRHLLTTDKGTLPLGREILSGAGAGMCQIIVTTPMELLKIQLQDAGRSSGRSEIPVVNLNNSSAAAAGNINNSSAAAGNINNSSAAAARNINNSSTAAAPRLSATRIAQELLKQRGILGLYQGCGATALRDITFSAIYFPLFAHLNAMGKRREGSDQAVFYHSFLSGCFAGCTASLTVNPVDVVKTRLQTLHQAKGEESYNGIIDCFTKVMKNEGPKAFYKGALCRILVIAPLFGIAQTVYYFGVGEMLLGMNKP